MKKINLKFLFLFFVSDMLFAYENMIQNQINLEQDKIERENNKRNEQKSILKTILEIEVIAEIEKTKTDTLNCFNIEKTILKKLII